MALAASPGHSATVLVALASTAGMRRNSSAGKEIKLPPPAKALSAPPIPAAKSKKMAGSKCKPIENQEKRGPEKSSETNCSEILSGTRQARRIPIADPGLSFARLRAGARAIRNNLLGLQSAVHLYTSNSRNRSRPRHEWRRRT